MILMPPELAPAGGWPVTVSGWITLAGVTITTAVIVWDRVISKGRRETKVADKIDNLCGKVDEMEGQIIAFDGLAKTVQELVWEWRGVDGKNGWKSVIRNDHRRIDDIERRNDRIDAIREEDEKRSGGKHRRQMDRELPPLPGDDE